MLHLYRGLRWLVRSIAGLWSDDPVEADVARWVWAFLIPLGIALAPTFTVAPPSGRPGRWLLAIVATACLFPFTEAATAIGRRDASEDEVFWFQAPPAVREVLDHRLRQLLAIVWGLAALNAVGLVLNQVEVLSDTQTYVMLGSVFVVLAPAAVVLGRRGRAAWRSEG